MDILKKIALLEKLARGSGRHNDEGPRSFRATPGKDVVEAVARRKAAKDAVISENASEEARKERNKTVMRASAARMQAAQNGTPPPAPAPVAAQGAPAGAPTLPSWWPSRQTASTMPVANVATLPTGENLLRQAQAMQAQAVPGQQTAAPRGTGLTTGAAQRANMAAESIRNGAQFAPLQKGQQIDPRSKGYVSYTARLPGENPAQADVERAYGRDWFMKTRGVSNKKVLSNPQMMARLAGRDPKDTYNLNPEELAELKGAATKQLEAISADRRAAGQRSAYAASTDPAYAKAHLLAPRKATPMPGDGHNPRFARAMEAVEIRGRIKDLRAEQGRLREQTAFYQGGGRNPAPVPPQGPSLEERKKRVQELKDLPVAQAAQGIQNDQQRALGSQQMGSSRVAKDSFDTIDTRSPKDREVKGETMTPGLATVTSSTPGVGRKRVVTPSGQPVTQPQFAARVAGGNLAMTGMGTSGLDAAGQETQRRIAARKAAVAVARKVGMKGTPEQFAEASGAVVPPRQPTAAKPAVAAGKTPPPPVTGQPPPPPPPGAGQAAAVRPMLAKQVAATTPRTVPTPVLPTGGAPLGRTVT